MNMEEEKAFQKCMNEFVTEGNAFFTRLNRVSSPLQYKKKSIESHLSKELRNFLKRLAIFDFDAERQKSLCESFRNKLRATRWFKCSTELEVDLSFYVSIFQTELATFSRTRTHKRKFASLLANEEVLPGKALRDASNSSQKPTSKNKETQKKQDGTPSNSRRALNRRNALLIQKVWTKFNTLHMKKNKDIRWLEGSLDLSKAPNRAEHWLFKIFRSVQQVLESQERDQSHSSSHSFGSNYYQASETWQFPNGVFTYAKASQSQSEAPVYQNSGSERSPPIPGRYLKWTEFILQFFSAGSEELEMRMPFVVRELKNSVVVCSVKRPHQKSDEQVKQDLKLYLLFLINDPGWPPLWLSSWVCHLILKKEISTWSDEPQGLALEINEKGTYFFYTRGAWQNHWVEDREGLAPTSKGSLKCAWNIPEQSLSLFLPSPSSWYCRLQNIYLRKKNGRHQSLSDLNMGGLFRASKAPALEKSSLNTLAFDSFLTPSLIRCKGKFQGRMGLLHDQHAGVFWFQSLCLIYLYFLEKDGTNDYRSPGSKTLPLILPAWFGEFPGSFLIYFNEALSGDFRNSEFNSFNASVSMPTNILPMMLLSLCLSMMKTTVLSKQTRWEDVEAAQCLSGLFERKSRADSLPKNPSFSCSGKIKLAGMMTRYRWFGKDEALVLLWKERVMILNLKRSQVRPIYVIGHCSTHALFLKNFLGKHLSFFLVEPVREINCSNESSAQDANILERLNLLTDNNGKAKKEASKEKVFDELDIFTYRVPKKLESAEVYTMPLESLAKVLTTPATQQREPALIVFWGVNSLLNVELNSADVWKQKRMAYHSFESLGRDDIPRLLILEPYYIDHNKDLKNQTYRKIIRSCTVSRFLLHFVVEREPLKCQKIRGTAAGKGSTCFSKSFLDCMSVKGGKEDTWRRSQNRMIENTFSKPLRLKDVVRSPGSDIGNVCFVVYRELSPLCHENMKPLWNKLSSERDRKVFMNLCFGEGLSVVWSSRYKAHQVYTLCSSVLDQEGATGNIKNLKPSESEVSQVLDRSVWIVNSGMRIAISCLIHLTLLRGVCIMNVEERNSCQTIPPLISSCLKKLKLHLKQKRLATLVDLEHLSSQIFEQNSLWTPLAQPNVQNFQGYLDKISTFTHSLNGSVDSDRYEHYQIKSEAAQDSLKQKMTCHLFPTDSSEGVPEGFTFKISGITTHEFRRAMVRAGCLKQEGDNSCFLDLRHPLTEKTLFSHEHLKSSRMQNIAACLSLWEPTEMELHYLFQAFSTHDTNLLMNETKKICQLLFQKTSLVDMCLLLNLCWLLDFVYLFELLCVSLLFGQQSPLNENRDAYQREVSRFSQKNDHSVNNTASVSSGILNSNHSNVSQLSKPKSPQIQAEDNIRSTIDDSSLHFAQLKSHYQYLGRILHRNGLMSSLSYSFKGLDEFWKNDGLAFAPLDTTIHFTYRKSKMDKPRSLDINGRQNLVTYTKKGSLNLIDVVLEAQGHRQNLNQTNNSFIWVVESNLLPNGTRLSTTTVSVPLPIGSVIHNKIPLDRFTGPVYIPLAYRFTKEIKIHNNLFWDQTEALKERLSEEQYKLLNRNGHNVQLEARHMAHVPLEVQKAVALYPSLFFKPFQQVNVQERFDEQAKRKEEEMFRKKKIEGRGKRGRKKKRKLNSSISGGVEGKSSVEVPSLPIPREVAPKSLEEALKQNRYFYSIFLLSPHPPFYFCNFLLSFFFFLFIFCLDLLFLETKHPDAVYYFLV